MKRLPLLVITILISASCLMAEVPYTIKDPERAEEVGAMNENMRALSGMASLKQDNEFLGDNRFSGSTGITLYPMTVPQATIGRIYFDSTSSKTKVSEDGATFVSVVTGNAPTLTGTNFSGIAKSSYTAVAQLCVGNCTTAGATFTTCVANSTVAITTDGLSPVIVSFIGALANNTAGSSAYVGVEMDGVLLSDGYASSTSAGANQPGNGSFFALIPAPSAATHSFCLALRASANTAAIYATAPQPQFGVFMLK